MSDMDVEIDGVLYNVEYHIGDFFGEKAIFVDKVWCGDKDITEVVCECIFEEYIDEVLEDEHCNNRL